MITNHIYQSPDLLKLYLSSCDLLIVVLKCIKLLSLSDYKIIINY